MDPPRPPAFSLISAALRAAKTDIIWQRVAGAPYTHYTLHLARLRARVYEQERLRAAFSQRVLNYNVYTCIARDKCNVNELRQQSAATFAWRGVHSYLEARASASTE